MDFKKYSSIENSYRTKFINKIEEEIDSKTIYMVTEKVHGSNFSFYYDGTDFKVAKRSGFIEDFSTFFDCGSVVEKYKDKVIQMYENLGSPVEIVVYGELYGGRYGHLDVKQLGEKSVQKGVDYCPHKDFICFDVKVNGQLLNMKVAHANLDKVGIPRLKILQTGTLHECLGHPNKFQTTIPDLHGLPEIEGNVCEGVVIKPIDPLFLYDRTRVIIKNKNEKFAEKQKEKRPPKAIDPEIEIMKENIKLYINENRLRAVLSKMGTITKEDFGKIIKEFSADVLEDLKKDEHHFEDKDKLKSATKSIGQLCASFIRKHFLNIIDGEF